MIIFRSKFADGDWKRRLALGCVAVGFAGFLVCWALLWVAGNRVLGHQEFHVRSKDRPIAIEMKGGIFFVEADYARIYRAADRSIFYIWMLGAGGMIYLERREMKKKSR